MFHLLAKSLITKSLDQKSLYYNTEWNEPFVLNMRGNKLKNIRL